MFPQNHKEMDFLSRDGGGGGAGGQTLRGGGGGNTLLGVGEGMY